MKLSDLEINIIGLVNKGLKNVEIAENLGYSEVYIKKILAKIYKKFKVKNKVELVRDLNRLE